jgi:flagellar basal body-associated protein FliL
MQTSKKGRKCRALRVIAITAAALTACGGAVCLFLKRKAKKRYYTAFMVAAVIFACMMMCGMTAYAAPEQETGIISPDTDTEPDGVIEVITGEETEIDIADFINPDREPNQLTPPGNLTLVDDYSGAQANEKQFITVQTKSGAYFYIIIDRAGSKENVHFLNLVDEADLLAILEKEKKDIPPSATSPAPEQQITTPDPTTPEPKSNNTMGLLIMTLVIAAIGGGAFYYFKVLKPKQGGSKKSAGASELDEFEFDPDEDDLFTGSVAADTDEQDGGDYEGDADMDEDIPDFTIPGDTEPENNESEGE